MFKNSIFSGSALNPYTESCNKWHSLLEFKCFSSKTLERWRQQYKLAPLPFLNIAFRLYMFSYFPCLLPVVFWCSAVVTKLARDEEAWKGKKKIEVLNEYRSGKRVEFNQLKRCLRSVLSTVRKKRWYHRLQNSFLW